MSRGGRWLALALLLCPGWPARMAAQCPDGTAPPCGPRLALDTARYVILPFAHREGSQPALLDGADCAELLTEAFGRWIEVRLTDKTRIYDALARRGARAPFRIAFGTGLAIARELGAGRLVMGQLWSFADTLYLTVGVYDAGGGGAPLREAKARVPAVSERASGVFNALADSLVAAELGAAAGPGAEQTRSIRALRAYTSGRRAMRTWSLGDATRQLRVAVAADSGFAPAYLSLGQVLLWAADSTPEAMRDRAAITRRSGGLLARLGVTEQPLLLAQQAMFERRWPDACARYQDALQRDSLSFDAWYGLAQCNAEDPVVIRDPADSSRFVFRGSWHTAVLAYRKALLLAPSFNFAFGTRARERMTRLLPAEEFWWREGRLDTVPYFAFPEVAADTTAFYPVSGAAMARGGHRPKTQGLAIARNRQFLVDITTAWVEAYPQDPVAHRALGYTLEVSGKIAPTMGEPRTALGEMAAAQRLERQPLQRAHDAVATVRLLVKAGEFAAARRVGDSLLRTIRTPTPGITGVAVLLGRPALAARLVAVEDTSGIHGSADNEPLSVPLDASLAGLRLLAYAAVAAPRESIQVLERRVEERLGTLPPGRRATARSALLDLPAELVFDVMGLRAAHRTTPPGPDGTMAMQWALAHGDTAFVRANLDTLGGSHEYAYVTARLALAVGDTLTARHQLDGTLGNLLGLYSALLDYVPLAGSLVRMMALRAELAAKDSTDDAAQRWSKAVVTLWSGAEPSLLPIVTRMNQIAKTPR